MAKSVCFYFEVHQPWRLSKFNILELGNKKDLFCGTTNYSNEKILKKVASKCYIPSNNLFNKLLVKYPQFKLSFSFSGVFLEQAENFDKKIIKSFQKLCKSDQVEILSETYYHSLAFLFSKLEFAKQIKLHRSIIWRLFKKLPTVFRNTELIYSDEIGEFIRKMGFKGMLIEGWNEDLGKKSPNFVYNSSKVEICTDDLEIADNYSIAKTKKSNLKLLLKNYNLSDDIAFRFSEKRWKEFPLTPDKFIEWILNSKGDLVNIFIDYETFGEHQWQETGIFDFIAKLIPKAIKSGIQFVTPSEAIKTFKAQGDHKVVNYRSWADEKRDLSAWVGNTIQDSAINAIYNLESQISDLEKGKKNRVEKNELINSWRKLQTSDHFYYMCTKHWNDGDVHKYFSPYASPYDAYINYMNVVGEFTLRLENFLH